MATFVASQTSLKVAASHPEPSPPPDDLEPPEKAMWIGLNREFVIHSGGQLILQSALQVHAHSRHQRAQAFEEGFMLETRLGNRITNPLLKEAQRSYRDYVEAMKLLKLKF